MDVTQRQWAGAFAQQARADFDSYNALAALNLPPSQRLHFLQMACEKLCKAHLCQTANPATLQSSHGYIRTTLRVIALQQLSRVTGRPLHAQTRLLHQIEQLAGEIDRLHPSVDDGGRRPDNCEYPWDDGAGNIVAPAEYTFPNLHLLTQYAGITLLLIVDSTITELQRNYP